MIESGGRLTHKKLAGVLYCLHKICHLSFCIYAEDFSASLPHLVLYCSAVYLLYDLRAVPIAGGSSSECCTRGGWAVGSECE